MYKNENEILSCFRQLSGENQIKLLSSARLVCKSWESGAASVRQANRFATGEGEEADRFGIGFRQ